MRHLSIVSAFCILLLLTNCDKPPGCGEARGLENSSLNISIFNTVANNYMYPRDEFKSPFKKDSLQVFNEDGRKFNFVNFALAQDPRNHLDGYYGVNISPAFIIPYDNDAFNQEKTRKIFLKYNYNTIDTLILVFKAFKNKCGKGRYEYLKVYFQGNVIASVDHTFYATFTLNH